MRTPLFGAAAALGLILSAGACRGSEDKSADEIEEDLSAELQSGGGTDEETADCLAKVIVDDIGADELQDVDLTDEEPPADLQREIAAAVTNSECID